MIELAHFVAIISDKVKEAQRFIRSFHVNVDLPSEMRFFIHDVAATQPAQVDIVALIFVTLNLQQAFLAILVVSS